MKFLIYISAISLLFSCSTTKPSVSNVFSRQGHRGGSSLGQKVEFDKTPSTFWKQLKIGNKLSKKEKDRLAILALSGEFQTKFNFLETFTLTGKELDTPYMSWGTEFVKVIENKPDFISLQHIMVMYYIDPKTKKKMGPLVMKHWRQDWSWQGRTTFEYVGNNQWKTKKLKSSQTRNKWVWSVYQVDDSPRYAGIGEWKHHHSLSTFKVPYLSRPLPRRERSYRDDYDLLLGEDQIILTSNAWYHEQKSWKHDGGSVDDNQFTGDIIAREIGHNSYRPIKGTDFSAGYEYWKSSSGYWQSVRDVWKEIMKRKSFKLKKKVNDTPLFAYHFDHAADPNILKMSAAQQRALVKKILDKFLD